MTKELNLTETVAQIEVTPEMREAGVDAAAGKIGGIGLFTDELHDLALAVYRAMECARRGLDLPPPGS